MMYLWQILLLSFLLFIKGGFATSLMVARSYIVVVDAGSSHTEFLVYEERPDCQLAAVHSCNAGEDSKSMQGIDSFVDNPGKLGSFLTSCTEEVKGVLLKNFGVREMAQVKLLLGATAGMRSLSLVNPQGAKKIMEEIQRLFAESGFAFENTDAFIMDGPDEGAYGWIAVNLLSKKFREGTTPTAGMLDMGGSSAQIGFECKEDTSDAPYNCQNYNSTELKTFKISGKSYTVLSHSTGCYGLEEAMLKLVITLAYQSFKETKQIAQELKNPCLPEGWQKGEKSTWLINFPTDPKEVFKLSSCNSEFPNPEFQTEVENILKNDDFQFKHIPSMDGDDGKKCKELVADFLSPKKCTEVFPSGACWDFSQSTDRQNSGSRDELTNRNETFYALSSYWWEFFRLMTDDYNEEEVVSSETVDETLDIVCNPKNGERLMDSLRSETDCFIGIFIKHVLMEGYGKLLGSDFSNIRFVNKVDNTLVSWPLGLAFSKIECPSDRESGTPTLVSSVVVTTVMLVLSFVVTIL